MAQHSGVADLIETMSNVLRQVSPHADPLLVLNAAITVVNDRPGASVEAAWDVAKQLAQLLS